MNKSKINKICLAFILLVIITVSFATLVSCKDRDVLDKYTNNWGVEFPEYEYIIYTIKTDRNWTGDGLDYIILKLKDTPTVFLEEFYEDTDDTIKDSLEGFFELNQDDLSIEEQYLPRWEDSYLCKELIRDEGFKKLYLLYYPQNNELIICEVRI